MGNCIICGGKITLRCRCLRSDTTCENGHNYHYGSNREIHEGYSNHKSNVCCINPKIIKTSLIIDKKEGI
jgi:hypothetical protein